MRPIINNILQKWLLLAMGLLAVFSVSGNVARAQGEVEFHLTDEPGRWFHIQGADCIAGNCSLAVANPGVEVEFEVEEYSNTVHTITSLLFPTGAMGMPSDTEPTKEKAEVELTTPGLYVFVCKIHPYMLGAVIVDDPGTEGLDLGESITLVNGITVPTSSDLATRLLSVFFIATNPDNWQNYASSALWHVTYPDVPVRITGGAVVNLRDTLNTRYGNDIRLPPLVNPSTPGVGEVWVDTQFELTKGKQKPGTATAVSAANWRIRRKVSLPQIEMNNPHNMWTDRDQSLIYQTQWFDNMLTVFDRRTGKLVKNISVGYAPAHVMTRVDTDQVHVTLNGEALHESVVELSPGANQIERRIDIERGNPHAHWMSHDGRTMVTPNAFTADSSIYDFVIDETVAVAPTGAIPIATGMMPDASKYFVANFLDSTITVIHTVSGTVLGTINLIANYDPILGTISGPVGGLPIQTPVSPDGKSMVTANTLTGTILIINPATHALVKMLDCDAGCHGVQYGAKKGGGYYAYVSSKFSNSLIVVDPNPNNDGDISDARIAGRILLKARAGTLTDDPITGNEGMGGQGILPIPVVYNGWVQKLPSSWKSQLTTAQQNPIP